MKNKNERRKRIAHLIESDPDIFRVRLNRALDETDVPMASIATDCGFSRDTLSSYIREAKMPNAKTLIYICQYLNVSADWLLVLSDKKRTVW